MKRSAIAVAKKQANSRIGNNNALLDGVDGRTKGARRYRELLTRLSIELAVKNAKAVQEHEMTLLRRAVSLAILCEKAEARMANGEEVDASGYAATTNALRRVMTDVGLIWPVGVRIRV